MNKPGYLRFEVEVDDAWAEPLSDLLASFAGGAVELSPPETGAGGRRVALLLPWDGGQGEREEMERRVAARIQAFADACAIDIGPPASRIVAEEDWATSWRRFFRPFSPVEGLVIRPSWEEYTPSTGEAVLVLDPGRAFGTGQHQTTRLVLGLLRDLLADRPCAAMLDLGCGSGILAMAAVRWGCGRAVAVDIDGEALDNARANLAANGLLDRVRLVCGSVESIGTAFPLVAANILLSTLVETAPELARVTAPGGLLACSGVLAGDQEGRLDTALAAHGLRRLEGRRMDEWCAVLYHRKE